MRNNFFAGADPKGYTILEILMTITLMGLLMGFGTISLFRAQHRASLSSTLDTFITNMQDQQYKAMTGDTQNSGAMSDYGIHFDDTSYTLFRGTYTQGNSENLVVNLPPTIQVSVSLPPNNMLVFLSGSGNAAGSAGLPRLITFTDISYNSGKTLTINNFGVIASISAEIIAP